MFSMVGRNSFLQRLFKSLPNILTLSGFFLGLASIMLVMNDEHVMAVLLILAGMLVDGLDGSVARMLKTESEMGEQLDSLSDVVTFGVAPALILYKTSFISFGIVGALISIIFAACGALRLARFNAQSNLVPSGHFVGLPITAAGGALAVLSLENQHNSSLIFLTFCTLFLSSLMVSRVFYPKIRRFRSRFLLDRTNLILVIISIMLLAFFATNYPYILPRIMAIPLLFYIIYGFTTHLLRRRRLRKQDEEPG